MRPGDEVHWHFGDVLKLPSSPTIAMADRGSLLVAPEPVEKPFEEMEDWELDAGWRRPPRRACPGEWNELPDLIVFDPARVVHHVTEDEWR